jgi:hypothetical protein
MIEMAAQERGEVRGDRQRTASSVEAVGVADIGLTHKDIHEARQIRNEQTPLRQLVTQALDRLSSRTDTAPGRGLKL